MLTVLQAIWATVKAFGTLVEWAVVTAINLLVAAVGAFIGAVLSLLPQLPDVPATPNSQAPGWVAWFIPIGGIITAFAGFVTMYLLFLVVRIALRWVKAL